LHISQSSAKFELKNEVRVPVKEFYEARFAGDFLVLATWLGDHTLLHIPTCQVYDLPPLMVSVARFMPIISYGTIKFAWRSSGARYQYAITSRHIICFSELPGGTVLETFSLPRVAVQSTDDATIPSLDRSRWFLHTPRIFHPILLTERHELHDNNDDPSVHYSFVAVRLEEDSGQLGFLDISLPHPVTSGPTSCLPTTWTHATELEGEASPGDQVVTMTGSSRAGVTRLLGWTASRGGTPIAITVTEDGDGKRVARSRFIAMDKLQQEEAFDGVHGRMCFHVSPAQVTVVSFV
jgi:hypothetical protein